MVVYDLAIYIIIVFWVLELLILKKFWYHDFEKKYDYLLFFFCSSHSVHNTCDTIKQIEYKFS